LARHPLLLVFLNERSEFRKTYCSPHAPNQKNPYLFLKQLNKENWNSKANLKNLLEISMLSPEFQFSDSSVLDDKWYISRNTGFADFTSNLDLDTQDFLRTSWYSAYITLRSNSLGDFKDFEFLKI
jgi:hypothetical protein